MGRTLRKPVIGCYRGSAEKDLPALRRRPGRFRTRPLNARICRWPRVSAICWLRARWCAAASGRRGRLSRLPGSAGGRSWTS